MTDIAERLARAVLDRIESDRLLNRDNVADAIRKELAVMKGPFWVPPLSPADYAPGAVPKPIGACTHVDLTVREIQEQLRQLPPEMALCKGGPLDGQTIGVKGLKHLCPGHAGAYYAHMSLHGDGTVRTDYIWQANAPDAGFAVPPSAITASEAASLEKWRDELGQLANRQPRASLAQVDHSRTDPSRYAAIGGPFSGSHRTYQELTEGFLGGHYEINRGLSQAYWIGRK